MPAFAACEDDVCNANVKFFYVERVAVQPDSTAEVRVAIQLTSDFDSNLVLSRSEPSYPHTFQVALRKLDASDPTGGQGSTTLTIANPSGTTACTEAMPSDSGTCQKVVVQTDSGGDSELTYATFEVEIPADVNASSEPGAVPHFPYEFQATLLVVVPDGHADPVTIDDMTGDATHHVLTWGDQAPSYCSPLNDDDCHCVLGTADVTGDPFGAAQYYCRSRHGVADIEELPSGAVDYWKAGRLVNGDLCVIPADEVSFALGSQNIWDAKFMTKFGGGFLDATAAHAEADFENRIIGEELSGSNTCFDRKVQANEDPALADCPNEVTPGLWRVRSYTPGSAWGECDTYGGDFVGFFTHCANYYATPPQVISPACEVRFEQKMVMTCRLLTSTHGDLWHWEEEYAGPWDIYSVLGTSGGLRTMQGTRAGVTGRAEVVGPLGTPVCSGFSWP